MNVLETNLDTGLGKAIGYYRRSLNMSQQELAHIVGVHYPTVSWWETGKTKPSIDNLMIMAKIFGVPEQELLHPKLTEELTEEMESSYRRKVRNKA